MFNFLPEVKAPYSLFSIRNAVLALFLLGGMGLMAQSTTISVIPAGPYCSGQSFSITFTKTGTFNTGNVFTAQLSDASGLFGSPVSLGTLSSTNAGSITVTLPTNVGAGTGYKMRVNGSNPQGSQTANATAAFSIREAYTPTNYLTETVGTVSSSSIATHESNSRFSATAQTYSGTAAISATTPSSGYTGASAGNNVYFTNSGENMVIQGLVTTGFERTQLSFGLYKGTNNQNGSNFVVEYTTTGNWTGAVALTFPALSNGTGWYPIVINEYLPAAANLWLRFSTTNNQDFRLDDIAVDKASAATVAITPSTAQSICSGASVNFSVSSLTGASYDWSNGVTTAANTVSPTSNTNYSVTVTDYLGCTPSRGPVAVNVTANVTPSVSISASATTICAGTSVTFTATPTNGGTPSYQWKVNGANAGTNSATFTSTTLANNDVVTVVMTSSLGCVTSTSATSTGTTMTVNPNLTPAISISPSANPICAGASVTFTATPTNGGASPSYQWKLGASNVGTNSSTYTNASLANGNSITCVITSNASCLATTTATSAATVMTVNANVTPSVSISASGDNNLCRRERNVYCDSNKWWSIAVVPMEDWRDKRWNQQSNIH